MNRKLKAMKRELIEGSIVGAVGGAAWGIFVGFLSGVGAMTTTTNSWEILISTIIIGAVIGAVFGSLILLMAIRAGFRS